MEEKDTLLTVDEFATKIKEKYPEYKDVDNLTLANKIVEKYPEYKSKVSFEGTPEVKKKDSTQPVQTQESPTQEGPLLGLGGVSERPTPSPSVGIGKGVFPAKSPVQDLKESIQDPLLKAQERAKRQQLEPTSSQNLLRTEKFVPYTDEVLEDADYKEWKSNLPENLQQETDGYDLYGAYKAGMEPIEVAPGEYHLSSRDPKTGRILKSEDHDTFYESVIEDDKLGYVTYKSKDGNIYSKKQYEIDIAGDAQEIFRVDDTGAVVKEVVETGEVLTPVELDAKRRAVKLAGIRQELYEDIGDKLFDEDYMSSSNVIDKYAPKDVKVSEAQGDPRDLRFVDVLKRDQEKEDRYNLALNEAKKSVLQDKLYGLAESGETYIDIAEADIDKVMQSYLDMSEYTDKKEGPSILYGKRVKKETGNIYEMLLPNHVRGSELKLDETISQWVDSKAEDMELSGEAKRMMKSQIKKNYKERKRLEVAANEVSKETGYNLDEVRGDVDKVVNEINSYENELKSIYTPYDVKAKKAQERMTLEFEQIQDRVINRVSNSQEYKDLLSEYQAKVNSGEITVEEANSALSQKINIMLSQSPEAVELQRKYQGVLSSYDSELRKRTEAIYSELQSSLDQLKGLSKQDEEYRKKLSDKVRQMYKDEQSEIDSDWKKLSFGGLITTEEDTKLGRGIRSGMGDLAASIAGGVEYLVGENTLSEELASINNQIKSDNPMIDLGEFGFEEFAENPFNEDWWATRVAPSAPLTFSLMAPGIGVGAGTTALATRVGLTGLSRVLVTGTVSGIGMRSMESFTEAGLQYYDLIERGESVDYASKQAAKTYSENMDLLSLDVAEMTTFFLPASNRLATMAKFVAQVPMNAAEELLQERLPAEELAYNRYLKGELTQKEIAEGVSEYEKVFSGGKFSDIYNFLQTDQGQEVALIGGIYGGAFGGASLPGDISRANSLRRLNNFLNEEIVRYSSTEVVRNAEGKPLEFGMGGVVAGPAETMQEAKNRRIWQLKSTLDEMQMKGLINEDDAKLGKKQIDFAFGVADQMPVNLPLVTRGQLLQKLTEIRDLEEGLEGMTNETLIDAQKKKIAKLKKESEEIIGGTAQGYFINNVSVTKEQFAKIASNSKFAEGVINGEIDVTIMNDADTQKGFAEAIEGYKTDKESYESAMESLGVTKAVRDEVSGYNESVTKEGNIGAKIAPIMTRVENSERINEKEIDAAIDDIFAEIEAVQNSDLNEKTKEIITNTLYNTAEQLDNYEFTTETRTKTVTQSRTAKNLGAFAEKVSVENFFDNAAGTIDGEENVRFTTDKGVVKATREDGTEFILDTPSMRIDDGNIVFDENGVLESVTVTDRSGTRVTFTGETAMDLAIRDRQNKVGSVPEAALFEIITEEVQVEEEVLKKQPKPKKDDTQVTEQEGVDTEEQRREEDAGQVQEPEVSEEEGATDTVLQEQEKVKPATQGIVSKLLEKVNNSNDDAVTKKRKRVALRAVANILNFKSNILPDTKVKVHETDESYRAATGVDGPGVYDATNDTIHINLAHKEAGDETVYHEMIHPIIYNAVKNETEARILTQRMVEGVVRSSGGNKAIVDKLKGWLEQYEASERPEETIAEVAGILASEFKNLGVSAKNLIMDYLNKMARKFGGKNLFRAVSKDADVVKVLNRLSEAMRAGEAITAEDLTSGDFSIVLNQEKTPDLYDMALEEMAEEYGYEPGGIISGGLKQRISGMNNLKDSSFNTSYNYGTKLNMPEPRTVESVLEEAGGAAIFINSDGTGVFVSKDGKNLQGGWRYLYFDENTSKDVGFAATSGNHVNKFYDNVEKIINYRDSKFPKQKGKPIATFVTIQNAESMLGEWYAGEFFMEGIDKAIVDGKIKGGIDGARSLLIEAAEKIKKTGSKEFIELVNSKEFETKEGRLEIAKKLASKDFSFGFRSNFFKSISPLKTISKTSLNTELKKALRDVNHGRIDFYDTYTDEVLLEKLKDSNYNEKSIGGITLGGFFTDISKSKKEFFDNRTSGLNHEMFNESFTSNGKTFLLDGGYHVSKMFPEMSFPTKRGYELYNKENNTNYSKKDAKKSPKIQLEISKFLLNKKEPFKNKLLADPFMSIAGTMYTSIAAPIGKQRKASPEKFVSELKKTKASDPTQYWSVDSVKLSDAKKGKVISVDGGYGLVSNDGDIKGVFKLPTSKAKGVADNILQEAVKQGGTKLDNFDGYLTKIYERNGFRIAARIPFNEEFAPDGWNKAKHGTPDVVAMVYDPNNELGIKEKKFDDYDAGIEYRNSFLEDKAPAAKKPGVKERKASAPDQKIRASIDFKNRYGKYFTISKEFNNQKHLENYIAFMERKGNKEVGIERFPIGLKERKPLKFRKPKVKSALDRAIDRNAKKAVDIKTTALKTDLKNARRKFIDFRGDIKDLTKAQKELEGVYERIINSLGSNGVAKLSFDKAYDQIYEGLGPKQREALDKIIIARRIVAVNENRSVNNVDSIEDLFNNVPDFFKKKGGDYVTSFEQTMVDISNTVSNTPLEKDLIIQEALTLMSLMPVMNSIASNQNLTQKEILSEQNKVINELKNALDKVLKSENITFSDEQGNKLGLNAAYELLDEKRIELGDQVYDKVNKRADKYFEKFQEMLDQDLADGIISQEQYNAMKGIDYSPRVFVQFIYGIDNEIINNTSEVDNVNGVLTSTFGLNKDAIRTLRDGVRNDDLDGVFFEMITNSEVLLGNYINSRERLRKMNDLNSYTLGQLTDLEARFNDLKAKTTLTKEEKLELETLKETFDAFSTKIKKGYLPVNFYEEGVKKKFYIRGDLYSQWYNLRPDLSIKLKSVDKILNSPIGMLKTFATGVLSPLFGITASAIDLTQLMIFSDAKGFSEIMPVKAAQIAKDLVGVPFFQKGVIQSILQEDELFIEAVNEGIMMDFLYTQGNMNIIKSMLKTGIETALEKTELGFGGYVKSKKALLKIAEVTLILNKMAELAPRLTAYQRTRDFEYAKVDKMLKDGSISKEEAEQMKKNARVKAAAIARELMNFAEGGEYTKGFVDRYSTYFNPAMQGTVTAARQTKENPTRTTSRAAQTAAMFSGMTFGIGYMLVAMLKSDDDDKEINEIIKETRDNASDYVKEKYFLIPTGKKDEDGNYLSIRLKKHPQMVPFYELFEIGYDNYLNGGDATSVLSKENALRINHAFFDNALPLNISPVDKEGNFRGKTILSEPFQRNPLLGGGLELITGYDLYRNRMIEPQTFNSKNADQAVKGLLNPYTEDFYKSFALEMQDKTGASLSPAEYKHFVERMITNPRNNFYVAAGYAMLNQVSDLDVNKKDKTFFDDTYSMISKKLIYPSTSKKGISKTKKSKFMDRYKANNNKTYLIRESARKAVDEVVKEGGLMKIANDEQRKGIIKEAFDKFKKNLDVVSETYPEMNMDVDFTLKEYGEYFANRVVFESLPVDELNNRKYQQILSEPHGMNKSENQALLFAHEFTKDGVMVNPRSEEFLIILEELEKTANNSNKKFNTADFIIEYAMIYNEENGVVSNSSKINEAYRQYRLNK